MKLYSKYLIWAADMRTGWQRAAAEPYFVARCWLNLAACLLLYLLLAHCLYLNRNREGIILHDPILSHLTPHDFSVPIFFLMYSSALLFLIYIFSQPQRVVGMMRAFVAVLALRVIFISLTPLDPPPDMILLRDPFIDHVVGFRGEVMNDLFFSGHVSDLYLCVFCCSYRRLRAYLLLAAVLVSIMIVWQKVHYPADVLAAPFFSYACYSFFVKK